MLDIKDATLLIRKAFPDGNIQKVIEYRNLFIFQVFSTRPFEEEMDPFFSVNRETQEVRDFSILTDGDISEITDLFNQANSP